MSSTSLNEMVFLYVGNANKMSGETLCSTFIIKYFHLTPFELKKPVLQIVQKHLWITARDGFIYKSELTVKLEIAILREEYFWYSSSDITIQWNVHTVGYANLTVSNETRRTFEN